MKENNVNEKINKIDNLLNNEIEFNKYIEQIEAMSELDHNITASLNNNILNKINLINNSNKQTNIIKFKNKLPNILKIVACTLFAIIMWETVFSSKVSYATNQNMNIEKTESFYEKIDEKLKEINNFFINSIKKERGN